MPEAVSLGRVAVLDRSEAGRRAVRAVRELAREGKSALAVAVHAPRDRRLPFVREADASVEVEGSPELALHVAGAEAAWLGPAPLAERAAFAEACEQLGVLFLGPSSSVLERVRAPEGLAAIAAEVGVPLAAAGAADPAARLLEVVVARDRSGEAQAVGVGDASLRLADVAVLAESPSPALGAQEDARARMLGLAIAAAARWVGIASVELLFDPATRRLVLAGVDAFPRSAAAIEAAAGVDLVRQAVRLAAGAALRPLPAARGFAVAARLLARDPEAPQPATAPGRLERLRLPSDPDVHAEAAVEEGDEARGGAEPMATIVALGTDRGRALGRLAQALSDTDALARGSGSSKAWLLALLARTEVRAGTAGVGFLPRLAAARERLVAPSPEVALLAAALESYELELDLERARFLAEARRGRPRVGPSSGRAVELLHAGERHRLVVRQTGPDAYRVSPAGGAPVDVKVDRLARGERRLAWGGRRARVLSAVDGTRHLVDVDGVPHLVTRDPGGVITSPLPGMVVALPVVPGQRVAAGEPVARVESMKVELAVPAPAAGVVREVLAVPNGQVDAGAPLLRLDPEGEGPPAAFGAPLALGGEPPPEPSTAHERYLAGLRELNRLLLGFDLSDADARALATGWRDRAAGVAPEDPGALREEERALAAFGDVQALFSRGRAPAAAADAPPPLEELWRYLHEPEARGEGLTPGFLAQLRRALAHYAVSLDAPGRELELALLRIQKAHDRAEAPLAAVLGILERRLAGDGVPPGLEDAGARELLDRLAAVGQERFPALGDLARELRYRRFEKPELDQVRAAVYAQAEADLAELARAEGTARETLVSRLIACPQPLSTLMLARMARAKPEFRRLLAQTLTRRYYRHRATAPATVEEVDGVACTLTEYAAESRRIQLVAAFAPAAELARAAAAAARLAERTPEGAQTSVDLYLWRDGAGGDPDAIAAELRAALSQAGFRRPLRRASVLVAYPARGLGRQASQLHFTFRGGPAEFVEEPRYRGVHPMIFRRMQLARLSKFELTRLPSPEDVYLYRGVARDNPRDERLFAVAEVRDLTPLHDARGRVVQLPHLERMLHEALAGMRRFQARRAPHQRLEWNRVLLTVEPPLLLSRDEVRGVAERIGPATQGLGLEMVLLAARVPHPDTGELRDALVRVTTDGRSVAVRWDAPTDRPLEPLSEYHLRVVQLRRRGLVHPFELVRMLAPTRDSQAGVPPGEFVEHDLDAAGALAPVSRPPGQNGANVVVGVVRTFTPRHPEGMARVVLLGDPSRSMGALAEPECRRIEAALDLAERLRVPLEWFAVSAGAKISMESGTENMDWISRVLRRIVTFTQGGGEINVVVCGINVGAQPYWNAEATMLMHTRGVLVMTPGSAMVLTGKEALDYSGSVSAEDNQGIGGYDRIMGPNGQAQYQAASVGEAIQILLRHYEHTYVAPGERFPRRATTSDPAARDVRTFPHGPAGGAGFDTVGDVFDPATNPDRKKPFDIRRVMAAAVDQDHPPLERWRDLRGGETAVVWDAHLGGWPVCLLGIESRPLPRLEFVPADGPELWSAGTLFPQSSKKLARAINGASGNRPVVVLANLSGFDGSPESMRRLQLEYGAEIGRAVVNFRGPFVFCVVSRYHGGAFVVFSKALREDIEVVAVEGARASVIGGAPAAAVVFSRDVETRTRKDPRVMEAEKAAAAGGAARGRLAEIVAAVRSEKVGEVADAFDGVHTVDRALRVGSLDRIITPADLRPYLVDAVARGIARHSG
ncbi:biotin/lipoyl attachment domain-containing protein [Anaeromyxobacter sp. K]|uniref:carboxyl transferase domain-containing protein n=1 Tax=Anaeromyxobacter sp. (strain K) TaxID=447217 RepID=UPI00017BE1AA|nr:carboxyl transferase domain-containing protein [Anaeromyxobacter sp. K]ACG74278.1 biotin/lipoyl attachment domain-containing protein [Anaeromyxobacter sp. K]